MWGLQVSYVVLGLDMSGQVTCVIFGLDVSGTAGKLRDLGARYDCR